MSLSGLIVGLSVGFYLSWQISLLMLVTLPLMAVGAIIMATAVEDALKEVQGPYEKAAALADEVLYAIRTVVAFGGEARELARYRKATDLAKRGGESGKTSLIVDLKMLQYILWGIDRYIHIYIYMCVCDSSTAYIIIYNHYIKRSMCDLK